VSSSMDCTLVARKLHFDFNQSYNVVTIFNAKNWLYFIIVSESVVT